MSAVLLGFDWAKYVVGAFIGLSPPMLLGLFQGLRENAEYVAVGEGSMARRILRLSCRVILVPCLSVVAGLGASVVVAPSSAPLVARVATIGTAACIALFLFAVAYLRFTTEANRKS